MYPVSARFLARLAESHTPVTTATLFRTDGRVETLPVVGGSVPVDRGAATRRTCSVTVPDPSLIPTSPLDKLSVYGAQIRLARGVSYADGTSELASLGVFRIDDVSGDVDDGPVTIVGKSLEAAIADDAFTAPYRATGTGVGAITALIQRTLPNATVVSRVTDVPIGPRTWDAQGNPWDAVIELAAALGAECYADADGVFVIAALPDLLTTPPVWTVAAGEGGAYIRANRGMSSASVCNGVQVSGENTETDSAPVSYLATDNDPSSPTYFGGPFGKRIKFYSSAAITTMNQATACANLLLAQAKAPNATADISSLPNPALEPGDVLRVVYGNGKRELHQIQSFTVPLEAGGDFTLATISAKEDS